MKKVGHYTIKHIGAKRKYDHDKIKSMILKGIRDQDIADEIGCHVTHVRDLRQDMGIYKRKHGIPHPRVNYSKVDELYSQGKNIQEIAEEVECSKWAVYKWIRDNGLPTMAELKEYILQDMGDEL